MSPVSVLYVCHSGELYGSQESLRLLLAHLPPEQISPFVSIARGGPLEDRLKAIAGVTLLRHKRLQWVKHDARNPIQQLGDILSLVLGALPRAWVLASHIRRHRVTLVHTNSMVSLEGALAARLARVPHVWHVRELFMLPNPKLHMVLGRAFTRWLILRLSCRVVCISQGVADQFKDCDEERAKVRLVYNAVEFAPLT